MAGSLSYSTRLGKTLAGWFQLLKAPKETDSDGKTEEANQYVCINCVVVQLSRDASSLCHRNLGDFLLVPGPVASGSARFCLPGTVFSTCIGE